MRPVTTTRNVTVGGMLRLHDTALGRVVPFEPREPDKVSMYVCGPTVYGPPHLGHGRFSLNFDVIRRYLEWSGFEVTYVSNITDIDDKIIDRANREGRDWTEITSGCEAVWYEAMSALGVKRPTHDPHATDYVDRMVELIARLVDGGHAYETSDGVYFRSAGVADYGLLARQDVESLRAGARVEVDDQKESPIDFALWKKAKPGEPSWDSPWGAGRPGWHTECVVMSLDILGDGFDIHGGGQDLMFPHHENERAQAVASGKRFARHWVHNGFVEVEGEKMSKSLGNFTNLLDLVERVDARAYRMLCLQSHYRSPFEVSESTTNAAAAALSRLDAVARRARGHVHELVDPDPETIAEFRDRMDDDLDTPAAMAIVFNTVTRINSLLDLDDVIVAEPLISALFSMLRAVGLETRDDADAVPADVIERAADRDRARASRDWAAADAIRDELVSAGWVVEDTADGTRVRPS
jgi:cysteinyl-tRNA synthetase